MIDREGSIWVGTNSGLDRLRRTALSTLPLPPAQEHDFSIAAGEQGSIWTGNRSLPLTHVAADGAITTFPKTGRDHLSSYSIAMEPSGLPAEGTASCGVLQDQDLYPCTTRKMNLVPSCRSPSIATTIYGSTPRPAEPTISHEGRWNREERGAGQKARRPGSVSRR